MNQLKVAIRFLKRHSGFTAINIIGLSVGMAVCLMIINYVINETSFDKFNSNYSNIYRVIIKLQTGGREMSGPFTLGNAGPAMVRELASVEKSVRFYGFSNLEIVKDENKFTNFNSIYADTSFFEIFDYNFISGIPSKVLEKPRSIVLSRSTAQTIFGNEDAFNKQLEVYGEKYTVTGVIEDFPINSHLNYDVLVSFSTICNPENDITKRDGLSFPTYILASENTEFEKVNEDVNKLNKRLLDELFGDYAMDASFYLQPLKEIHLNSDFTFDIASTNSKANVYLFLALAVFIIVIAIINFINLSTVLYEKRSKEIGIRKVVGAVRFNLMRQFAGESVLVAFISLIFALALVEFLDREFSILMGTTIPVIYKTNWAYLALVILFVFIVGLISGFYPSFYLSGVKPLQAMRGMSGNGSGKNLLRKILVIFQFIISVFIIIVLLLLYFQMNYVKNKDLGFDRQNVMVYQNLTENIKSNFDGIKAELLRIPAVKSVSSSRLVPGRERSSNNMVYKDGETADNSMIMNVNSVGYDYFETYGMEIIKGRDFLKESGTDTASYIINEVAAKKLGLEDPIGQKIHEMSFTGTVIGLVKDFNIKSLHNPIEPLVIKLRSGWYRFLSIRISPKNQQNTIKKIAEVLGNADQSYQPDYFFVDNVFRKHYEKEDKAFQLFFYAAILAILISVLGMYSLTAFTTQKRIKEIGIRKTLGASVNSIVLLLTNSITRWVVIATLIAWPLAWIFMADWLQKFNYSIEILDFWWCFLLAALISYIQAILTVSFQSVKAANSNPVDALKYE